VKSLPLGVFCKRNIPWLAKSTCLILITLTFDKGICCIYKLNRGIIKKIDVEKTWVNEKGCLIDSPFQYRISMET